MMTDPYITRARELPATPEAPKSVAVQLHLVGAFIVAVLGALMIMTGALVPFGIVTIALAILYAAAAWIVGMVQNRIGTEKWQG